MRGNRTEQRDAPAANESGSGPSSGTVEVSQVSKWFQTQGDPVHALDDISLEVASGEFVSIIGPSGCGKSTLLRIIHGLIPADAGHVVVGGQPVSGPSSRCAMVFQSVNLFPWRSALRNVEFGFEMQGVSAKQREERARELLETVGLRGFEESWPKQLSGGMQQRVGLARALAVDPDLLYMDEPFGALDAQTKVVLQVELDQLVQQFGKTVIFVTHDMEEAVFLSDRVVVMSGRPGKILEDVAIDLPRPRTDEVRKTTEFAVLKDHVWDLLREYQVER